MNLTEYTFERLKDEPAFFFSEDSDGGYALIYFSYNQYTGKYHYCIADSDGIRYQLTGVEMDIDVGAYMLGWTNTHILLDDLIEVKEKVKIYKRTSLIDDFF